MVFGISSPCMCLTHSSLCSDSTPPLVQQRVATTRRGWGSFWSLWVRSTVFGTFSPHTRLSNEHGAIRHSHWSGFSFVIWVCILCRLPSARVLGVSRGFWVYEFFWDGCSGFLIGFRRFVGLWCFRGRFGCLTRASTIFLGLGFTWVLGVVGAFWSGGFDKSFCCFRVLGL
jgi:hypothetical protein